MNFHKKKSNLLRWCDKRPSSLQCGLARPYLPSLLSRMVTGEDTHGDHSCQMLFPWCRRMIVFMDPDGALWQRRGTTLPHLGEDTVAGCEMKLNKVTPTVIARPVTHLPPPRHWRVYSPSPVLLRLYLFFVWALTWPFSCLGVRWCWKKGRKDMQTQTAWTCLSVSGSENQAWVMFHPLCGKASIADVTTVRLVMNETGGATLHNTSAACLPQTCASWRAYSQSPRQFGWLIALLSSAARGNREVRRDNNNNKNGREGRKEGRQRSHKVRAMSSLLFSAVRSVGLYSCQWTSRVTGGLAGTDVLTQHALGWLLRHLKSKSWLPLFLDQIKKS